VPEQKSWLPLNLIRQAERKHLSIKVYRRTRWSRFPLFTGNTMISLMICRSILFLFFRNSLTSPSHLEWLLLCITWMLFYINY
jgi:hypothetical protein